MNILWKYLRPHRLLIALSLLFAATAQLLNLLDPIIFGYIIDNYATNKDQLPGDELMHSIISWLLLALGIAILARLCKAVQDFVTVKRWRVLVCIFSMMG